MNAPVTAASRRDVRSDIMDAAEKIFATLGFAGATTRAIAEEAGVNLGLIHYHFNSKESLFEQVIARRSAQVNSHRRKLLAQALAAGAAARLEDILEALMRPTIEMSSSHGSAGQSYSRIIVQIASGTDDRSIQLTAENFNGIAREFIEALEANVEGLDRENAVWAYMNAISVGMLMMARTGRISDLSDGLCDETDTEATIAKVVQYLAAGTKALAVRQ